MLSESRRTRSISNWQVRRTRLPRVRRRCLRCASDIFEASGKFRINANAKLLDVWLLLHCASCERTMKATVIERSASIDGDLLRRFERNDLDLIAEVLLDPDTARRNRFSLDWDGSWEVVPDSGTPCRRYPRSVRVTFADPIPLRPTQVIAHGLGVSRSRVKHMMDTRRITLSRRVGARTSIGFEFTLPSEDD